MLAPRVERLLAEHPPTEVDPRRFLGAQFDAGLAWVHFPEGHGGLGLDPGDQVVVDELLRDAGAPTTPVVSMIGLGMGAPVVMTHGSEEQKRRYLRPLFTGEEIWCQLFSEPGAGSDVAALATTATRDGDEWVVNGQKVWTSVAHVARWGMLAARTDPDQPKHKGMTYFVMDMHASGVEIRPLRQITGDAEFNEVFFSDARVPDSERLGDVGEGWTVMLTTLMNERVAIGGIVQPRGGGMIGVAVEAWRKAGDKSPVLRDRLAGLWVEAECLRLTALRAAAGRNSGVPGPEGSIGKLVGALLNQRITEFCLDVLGPAGTLYGSYEMEQRPRGHEIFDDLPRAFLRARANSIEGGTSEVMRNILGERVLGLPGDVRVDRDRSWREVPRN
ncbi:MAG TPA: acyl-CoA dehydrogenase family protein [Acidimicrobiales bacterium]|nr:acyl-CoA dehydrogenase family protein [Acidimicrobiales bacterium]